MRRLKAHLRSAAVTHRYGEDFKPRWHSGGLKSDGGPAPGDLDLPEAGGTD